MSCRPPALDYSKEEWVQCKTEQAKKKRIIGAVVIVITLILTIIIFISIATSDGPRSFVGPVLLLVIGLGIGGALAYQSPENAGRAAGVRWETEQRKVDQLAGGPKREDESDTEYQARVNLARENVRLGKELRALKSRYQSHKRRAFGNRRNRIINAAGGPQREGEDPRDFRIRYMEAEDDIQREDRIRATRERSAREAFRLKGDTQERKRQIESNSGGPKRENESTGEYQVRVNLAKENLRMQDEIEMLQTLMSPIL